MALFRFFVLLLSISVLTYGECLAAAIDQKAALSVSVGGCNKYEVNEFGRIVYIVIGEDCKSDTHEIFASVGGNAQTFTLSEQIERLIKLSGSDYKFTLFMEKSWRKLDNPNSWSPRDGVGALVFKGKVFLLGGWNHKTVVNEVWVTDDLHNWRQLSSAPWRARHGAGWIVHKDRIYVIGGDLIDDVWSSADGINWNLECSGAPFGKRYTPIVQSIGDYIYLYGGQYWDPVDWCSDRPDCKPVAPRDVWRSQDGVVWERLLEIAPWSGRGLIHGSAYFENKIFLVGGGLKNATGRSSETYSEYADIWTSSDGLTWNKVLETYDFPSRTHFSVLSTSQGCYISDGSIGIQSNVTNDLFYASDCINYKKIKVPKSLPARHASSLFEFNKSIVVLGGPLSGGASTDLWQFFPKIKDKK